MNYRSQFPMCLFLDRRSTQKIPLIRKVNKKRISWLRSFKGSAGVLLKHTAKPLDPPLIVISGIADPVIIYFVS